MRIQSLLLFSVVMLLWLSACAQVPEAESVVAADQSPADSGLAEFALDSSQADVSATDVPVDSSPADTQLFDSTYDLDETTADLGPELPAAKDEGLPDGNPAPDAVQELSPPETDVGPPECVTSTDCALPLGIKPCLVAKCVAGSCGVGPAPDGAPCTVEPWGCIAVGTCKAKACVSTDECCDDKVPCTKDLYSWLSEKCEHELLPLCKPVCTSVSDCNDQNPCTTDSCSVAKTCTFDAIPGCPN